jgi:hypothetical protein
MRSTKTWGVDLLLDEGIPGKLIWPCFEIILPAPHPRHTQKPRENKNAPFPTAISLHATH